MSKLNENYFKEGRGLSSYMQTIPCIPNIDNIDNFSRG